MPGWIAEVVLCPLLCNLMVLGLNGIEFAAPRTACEQGTLLVNHVEQPLSKLEQLACCTFYRFPRLFNGCNGFVLSDICRIEYIVGNIFRLNLSCHFLNTLGGPHRKIEMAVQFTLLARSTAERMKNLSTARVFEVRKHPLIVVKADPYLV